MSEEAASAGAGVATTRHLAFRHDSACLRTILTDDAGPILAEHLTSHALCRALVVCSERESRSPLRARIMAALGDGRAVVFAKSEAHPTLAIAAEGATVVRREGIDCLIALGGGSASDQAKGIALWHAEGGEPEPIAYGDAERARLGTAGRNPALPIFAVPTTASGAELTPGFGQRDATGRKRLFRDYRLFCSLIVLDRSAIATTPLGVLVPSCMNAIAHCVEALYSAARDPLSDSDALAGLARLRRGLVEIAEAGPGPGTCDDILVGAHLAGRSIVNARTGLHHALCHVLGAAGLSHGIANAIILPHVVRFNGAAAADLLAPACAAFGIAGGDPPALADAVDDLCRRFRLPRRLSDLGVALDLERIAAQVMLEPGRHFNPRPIHDPAEIRRLVERAI